MSYQPRYNVSFKIPIKIHQYPLDLFFHVLTLAAGCSTSKSLRIVAPSLVIVTSPMSSTIILSSPTGPKDDYCKHKIGNHKNIPNN